MNYQAYIRSGQWQQKAYKYKKKIAKQRKDKRATCRLCSSFGPLDVHHLTYARLGNELMGDLLGLCRSCHTLVHDLSRVGREERARFPRKFKKARAAWHQIASRRRYWNLRWSDPAQYRYLANAFFYDFFGQGQHTPKTWMGQEPNLEPRKPKHHHLTHLFV